jgi:single-strand DNA-binding protein
MASLNKVFLMGNLTRDPELKHLESGNSVCNFGIAVNRKYKQGEEWKTEVSFFNITVWGKSGENCAKYLAKGKAVLVEGRLNNRSWEAQDGTKRTATDIVADNVQFLSGKSEGGNSGNDSFADNGFTPANDDDSDAVPF